ncbi:hypothetical protein MTO96_032772, partial [Rhipicephalus appendiculatus]
SPTPPPGHVGAECNASFPCLGEAQCEDGVCRCDEPKFRVVSGVCVSTTARELSDKSGPAKRIGTEGNRDR